MTSDSSIPGGDFRLFLQKIAMQGFYALGLVEIPGAPKTGPNLAMARSVIDDIRMIQEKCEGNLDEGERQTLEKYLSDLQLQYLAAEKGDANQEQAPNEENISSEEKDTGT